MNTHTPTRIPYTTDAPELWELGGDGVEYNLSETPCAVIDCVHEEEEYGWDQDACWDAYERRALEGLRELLEFANPAHLETSGSWVCRSHEYGVGLLWNDAGSESPDVASIVSDCVEWQASAIVGAVHAIMWGHTSRKELRWEWLPGDVLEVFGDYSSVLYNRDDWDAGLAFAEALQEFAPLGSTKRAEVITIARTLLEGGDWEEEAPCAEEITDAVRTARDVLA